MSKNIKVTPWPPFRRSGTTITQRTPYDKLTMPITVTSTLADGTRLSNFTTTINAAQIASSDGIASLYGRTNWTFGDNSNALLHGVEGVAGSNAADESITLRGGYFRTYTQAHADAPNSTARTSIGCEISARAGYSGGNAIDPEAGTAFVGARIWMAPYFAGSYANINNFHGLWVYNEHATQAVTNGIKIESAGGGFTNDLNLQQGSVIKDEAGYLTLLPKAGNYLIIGDAGTTSHTFNTNDDLLVSGRLEVNGLSYFDANAQIADDTQLLLGSDSDWSWKYDETTTDSLILMAGTAGAFAFKTSTISGFVAANDTAGTDIYTATPNGGTVVSGTTGRDAGKRYITTGSGSAAKAGSGANGGAGGHLYINTGAGGAGDGAGTTGDGGDVTVTLGAGTNTTGGTFNVNAAGAQSIFTVTRTGAVTSTTSFLVNSGPYNVSPANPSIWTSSTGFCFIAAVSQPITFTVGSDEALRLTTSGVGGYGIASIRTTDSAIINGDILGQIDFRSAAYATGAQQRLGAKIVATGTGTWGTVAASANDAPTKLEFFTQTAGSGDGTTTSRMKIDQDGAITMTQGIVDASTPTALTVTGAAHTLITAATEDIGVNLNFSATKTWAAGAGPLAAQREILIQAPTYAGTAATALTITKASTFVISGAPITGSNITITNAYALEVTAGNTFFGGRICGTQGSDVASANDMTLTAGNYFDVTGAVQINGIAVAGWTAGSIAVLQFDGAPTVKHNTAASAGYASILLANSADFVASANDTLTLVYDGTTWREVARCAI